MKSTQEILITHEPVELYKILKFEGLTSTGGEAKLAISDGLVSLNGETETRKRKKVFAGDHIKFNEQSYTIALSAES